MRIYFSLEVFGIVENVTSYYEYYYSIKLIISRGFYPSRVCNHPFFAALSYVIVTSTPCGSIQCVPQNPIHHITYIIQSLQLFLIQVEPSELAVASSDARSLQFEDLPRYTGSGSAVSYPVWAVNPGAPPSHSSSSAQT